MNVRTLIAAVLLVCPAWAAAQTPAGAASREVGYALTLLPGSPPNAPTGVRVTLRVEGEADGTSRLASAPSWGGVNDCERFVNDLSVTDEKGRSCPIATDASAPHGWNIAHEPGATLVATYLLKPSGADPLSSFGTHYEPVVRDDLLHLIGETGFIYPEWLEDEKPVEITFAWDGFKEAGWNTVSSFEADNGRTRRTLQEFRHAMFLAGKIRVHEREIHSGRLGVAIYSDDWAFQDAEMVDLVEQIVRAEREFVKDFDDPYFLVTVTPTGARANERSVSMGGTGLTNCFALFLAPGTGVAPDKPHRKRILHLLAHEYFHTWIGGEIASEEPEELAYWFSEGFTDFYASRVLRRAGLINDAEWTERLNETIQKLWLSPVATEPATTIEREFWTRREVQELPYSRGELVALMIDEEIRRVSNGARSLDDLFLGLLSDARTGEKVETGRMMGRIAACTSPEFAEAIRRIVVDGALPDPPTRLASPDAARRDKDTHRYDAGFDIDATVKTRIATGVREGSAAHAAGLRDGQSVVGFSIYHGDPDKEVTLTLRENDGKRDVRFYPRGAPIRIPVYVMEGATPASGP